LLLTVVQKIKTRAQQLSSCFDFWVTVTSRPNGSPYAIGPLSGKLVYCGQTVGWIKIPHGLEVGLGRGHIVLDGDVVPSLKKGTAAPNFLPMSIMDKRLDRSTCHLVQGYRPRPTRHCVRWGLSPPQEKGAQQPPLFGSRLLWPNGRPSQQLLSSCFDFWASVTSNSSLYAIGPYCL